MSAAIELRGLTVDLPGGRSIGPVDLAVSRGEHVLLVGPSGCGKTTLLRAVAGLVAPAAGTVSLFGALASEPGRVRVRPEERGVGMLFQGGALWPHMSVRRTLAFALRASGNRPTSERVAELLSWVRLDGMQERMPSTLSGGEKQRLALARALAGDPRVLLLDEPLGSLHAELRTELLDMLARLHDKLGWTTLHVTHDPDEARVYAARVQRMEDGRLVDAAPWQTGQTGPTGGTEQTETVR